MGTLYFSARSRVVRRQRFVYEVGFQVARRRSEVPLHEVAEGFGFVVVGDSLNASALLFPILGNSAARRELWLSLSRLVHQLSFPQQYMHPHFFLGLGTSLSPGMWGLWM